MYNLVKPSIYLCRWRGCWWCLSRYARKKGSTSAPASSFACYKLGTTLATIPCLLQLGTTLATIPCLLQLCTTFAAINCLRQLGTTLANYVAGGGAAGAFLATLGKKAPPALPPAPLLATSWVQR